MMDLRSPRAYADGIFDVLYQGHRPRYSLQGLCRGVGAGMQAPPEFEVEKDPPEVKN